MFVEGKITGRMQGDPTRDFQALQGLNDLKDCVSSGLICFSVCLLKLLY